MDNQIQGPNESSMRLHTLTELLKKSEKRSTSSEQRVETWGDAWRPRDGQESARLWLL